jgi:HK97 family phage portal protein
MKTLVPVRATKGIDQTAMSEPYGSAQYVPLYNLQTWTGYGISAEMALNIITVYQCVRVLAETFAQLPLVIYRRRPDGGADRATDHELYPVLHDKPNPDMTSFVWRELLLSHLATWGDGYNEIYITDSGRTELWPIRPDRVEVRWGSNGQKDYYYLNPLGAKSLFKPGTIFHVQGMSSDGLHGFSPITVMRKAIALYQSAEQYGTGVFDNNARPATVLTHPGSMSEPAIRRLASQMEELRGSRNAGKTVVLEEGLTLTEVGFPPEDAQFMQTRLFQKREIAAAYRIPPHKVGDLERATFSNIEQQSLEFVQDTMMPWFVRVEQEINTTLIDDPDYYCEFLVDGLLRADAVARSTAFATRWQHGTLSGDEWRAKENENPIPDGLGKQYYVPVNYAPINPVVGEQVVAPATVRETVQAPIQPGEPPQLTAVKSANLRCATCDSLLAEVATAPYRLTCRKCKTVAEAA